MFYITQVYIPNTKRISTVQASISKRISRLIGHMSNLLSQLAAIYIPDHKGQIYTEEELAQLLAKLHFSDNVEVVNARDTTKDHIIYLTVREWLTACITNVEKDIDSLFKYYAADISVSLMEVLEEIPRSSVHTTIRTCLL